MQERVKISTKHKKYVRNLFASVAPQYDFLNTFLSFGLHHWWKRKAASEAAPFNGCKVLDLCTGTGDLAILLARKVGDEGKVFAVDFCPEMLEIAREKVKRSRVEKRVKFIEADASSLPFKDGTFDAVTIGYGIRNIANRKEAFTEISRVLKKDGKVVCLEFSEPSLPVMRSIYSFYLSRLLPLVGRIFTGGDAYCYLPKSIKAFPDQEELGQVMKQAGFSSVRYSNLSWGISAIHVGLK